MDCLLCLSLQRLQIKRVQDEHDLSQEWKDIDLAHTYICLIQEGWARKEQTKAPAFPSCSPLQARNEKRRHLIFPRAGQTGTLE